MNSISNALFKGASELTQKSSLEGWLGRDISPTTGKFWSSFFGSSNFSGKPVTERSVLQLSAAAACIRLISETISTLPIGVYKQGAGGAPTLDTSHPIHRVVAVRPNPYMSPAVYWQSLLASLMLHGNGYSEKMIYNGRLVGLDFLLPQHVTFDQLRSGAREWYYNDPIRNTTRTISDKGMWHVPGFTLDGRDGISVIAYGANTFGTAQATDEASADTFKRSMKSPGLVTMDTLLSPDQRRDIRQHVKEVADNGQFMVLEKGAGFKQLMMNPVDAELLASRIYNIDEICRWYRVQPTLIGHGGKDSNWGTGLEEKMSWFVTLTLRPWAKRLEDGVKKDLFSPGDAASHSMKFGLEGLLRGDSSARSEFYSKMVNNGIYTRDDCRILENMPPKGGNADVLTVQSAMLPIDMLGQLLKSTQAPAGTPENDAAKLLIQMLERK